MQHSIQRIYILVISCVLLLGGALMLSTTMSATTHGNDQLASASRDVHTALATTRVYLPLIASSSSGSDTGPTMATYYVAPNGSDTNPGTLQAPFATITKARDVVRATKGTMTGNIIVYVRGGTYTFDQTLAFDERDSGNNKFNVIYRAYGNEKPLLSGGRQISGWSQVAGTNLWKASVVSENFRQLYVNGARRTRARSPKLVGQAWHNGSDGKPVGYVVDASLLPGSFTNPKHLQLHTVSEWRDYLLPVDQVLAVDAGKRGIVLKPGLLKEVLDAKSGSTGPEFNTPVYLENDLALLDTAGEWYFNPDTHDLFYWPMAGETMSTAQVVAPSLLQLMTVQGSALDKKVHHLRFEGLTFAYAGRWTAPDKDGWWSWQAQWLHRPFNVGITPATISVNAAEDIVFERNIIEHMGVVGLGLTNGVNRTIVRGNVVRDIGDSGITVGHFNHFKIDAGEEVTKDNLITNNLIYQAGQDTWGGPGIQAYYTTRLTITHNDISDMPYSGIAVGWGWQNVPNPPTSLGNKITNNRIVNVMATTCDGGGIYTLGPQPDSEISGNYIKDANTAYGGLYFDAGSAYFKATNNVIDSSMILLLWVMSGGPTQHDLVIDTNYTNMPNAWVKSEKTTFTNTIVVKGQAWPDAAKAIIDAAGLEPAYRSLRSLKPATLTTTLPEPFICKAHR